MFRTGLYVIQADSGKIIYQQIRNVYHAVQCRYGSELYQYETVTFTGQLLGIDPSGLCGAWTIMVMRSFFQSLPLELEEAAKIDGCGPLKIFSKIVIPLSKPMLATMTLFSFVGYWNTYFNSVMYITSTAKQTLQVYVQKIVLSSTVADVVDLSTELATTVPQEVMRMAAVVVVIIPILIIYPFLQKYFQTGMMVGAVKG